MADPATTPPRPRQNGFNVRFEQLPVIPHETTPPPRPRLRTGRGRGRVGDPAITPPITHRFFANTCRRCHHITVAGLWVGLRVDLEPETLTDLDEYRAIAADVRTWDLYPDRTAEPRSVAHIAAPTSRGTRHARHTCGTTYGSQPLPPPRPTYVMPDEPAF